MKWLFDLFKKAENHNSEKASIQFDVSDFLTHTEIDPMSLPVSYT